MTTKMTRDEIINMPAGREMDTLVAEKVMELCVHDWTIYKYNDYEGGTCKKCNKCHIEYWGLNPPLYGNRWKEFSLDISAAWEVVEKLKEKWDIVDIWHEKDTGFSWWCEMAGNGDGENASADTAPLAICRAALLAVMEELDDAS